MTPESDVLLYVIATWIWIHKSVDWGDFNGVVFGNELFKQGDTRLDFVDEVSLCIGSEFGEAVFYFA